MIMDNKYWKEIAEEYFGEPYKEKKVIKILNSDQSDS